MTKFSFFFFYLILDIIKYKWLSKRKENFAFRIIFNYIIIESSIILIICFVPLKKVYFFSYTSSINLQKLTSKRDLS